MSEKQEIHILSKTGVSVCDCSSGISIDNFSCESDFNEYDWRKIQRKSRISLIENIVSIAISLAISPAWLYVYLLLIGYVSAELKPIASPILSMQLGILFAMLIIATFFFSLFIILAAIEGISSKIQKQFS